MKWLSKPKFYLLFAPFFLALVSGLSAQSAVTNPLSLNDYKILVTKLTQNVFRQSEINSILSQALSVSDGKMQLISDQVSALHKESDGLKTDLTTLRLESNQLKEQLSISDEEAERLQGLLAKAAESESKTQKLFEDYKTESIREIQALNADIKAEKNIAKLLFPAGIGLATSIAGIFIFNGSQDSLSKQLISSAVGIIVGVSIDILIE